MTEISSRSVMVRFVLLTIALLLAMATPAVAKKKPDEAIAEIKDDRIQESSGLALSAKHDNLVYTMNDEGGSGANIYAVQVSTGDVVGATDISSLPIEDPESIAVDRDGTLWLADLGDNDHVRDDTAIYAFAEPGPGNKTASGVKRYGVRLPGGSVDAEGLLVHPTNGDVFVVTKSRNGNGKIFQLSNLEPGATAQAREVGEAPEFVTDAAFTNDGRWALLRTEKDLYVYDPNGWQPVAEVKTPKLEQGESVTVERGDQTVLLGSEGKKSPLVRIPIPAASGSGTVSIDNGGGDGDDDDSGSTVRNSLELAIPLGLVAAALLVGAIVAQRRLKL